MKGKHLALLLLLVVLLGGAGYYLQKGNQSSWSASGAGSGGKVLELPLNDVAAVHLKTATADLNLVKKNDEWTVQERADYPASYEQVSGLLRKFWDLKTVQEVKVGPSQMARLDLVEPGKGEGSGTLVEFKDKDGKTVSAILLGKQHLRKSEGGPMGDMPGFPTGRYVMPLGEKSKVSLVSEAFEDADPKPERWLRKDFVKIENPKSITLDGQTDAMKWKLERSSASEAWKLADAKPDEQPLDTSKVSAFATMFSNPSFKDALAPDAKPEETGLDKPTTATIETFDGFTYALKIGKLTNDAYPLQFAVAGNFAKERTPGKDEKPEDKTRLDEEFKMKLKGFEDKLAAEKKLETRTYLVEKFTIDPLLKDRAALLTEKKPEPAPGAPAAGTPGGVAPTPPPAPGSTALPTPPTSATTPPVSVTMPPTSVTTPPVAAPPQSSATSPPVTATTPPVTAPPPTQPPPGEAAPPRPAPAPSSVPAPAPPERAPTPPPPAAAPEVAPTTTPAAPPATQPVPPPNLPPSPPSGTQSGLTPNPDPTAAGAEERRPVRSLPPAVAEPPAAQGKEPPKE